MVSSTCSLFRVIFHSLIIANFTTYLIGEQWGIQRETFCLPYIEQVLHDYLIISGEIWEKLRKTLRVCYPNFWNFVLFVESSLRNSSQIGGLQSKNLIIQRFSFLLLLLLLYLVRTQNLICYFSGSGNTTSVHPLSFYRILMPNIDQKDTGLQTHRFLFFQPSYLTTNQICIKSMMTIEHR